MVAHKVAPRCGQIDYKPTTAGAFACQPFSFSGALSEA